MSGIVGLFNLDGKPAGESDLHTLLAACRRPAVATHSWRCRAMGLAHRPSSPGADEQPFLSPSGVAVAFDGRLDNREELEGPPVFHQPHLPRMKSDAAFVAAAHRYAGEGFASHLNGDFVVAVCDPSREQLLLARDVMGARRLHYTRVGQTLLFASEIKALLAYPGVSCAPNEEVLAEHVLDRWADPGRTCFRGIEMIPPGHVLLATPGAIEIRTHWAFDPGRQIRYKSFDEYVERFRALFKQSVRRRTRSGQPVAASLSGGLDSSSIFCEAVDLSRLEPGRSAVRGLSMTFAPGSPADEQQFIDELDSGGASIERVRVSELRVLQDAADDVANLEVPDLAWDAFTTLCTRARLAGCTVLLDGYFGDEILFSREYLLDLAWQGSWLKVGRHLREFPVGISASTGWFARDFASLLWRSLMPRTAFDAVKRRATARRAARYPACFTSGFVQRLLDWQLTRYGSAPRSASHHARGMFRRLGEGHGLFHLHRQGMTAALQGLDVASPYRDRDLVEFLMAIPGDVVTPQGVPKGLLRHAVGGLLPEPIRNRRWKADFTFLVNEGALREFDAIQQLLTPRSMVVEAGFVDGRKIRPTLERYRTLIADDHTNESAIPAWHLTGLVALELWLRHFFGRGAACTTS